MIASAAGIPTVVADAASAAAALSGGPAGTYFAAARGRRPATRLLWLKHAAVARGSLRLDHGAVEAVVTRRASLLPAGITGVEGTFDAGDPVNLRDEKGTIVARGLVNYDATEIPSLMGRSTRWLASKLGPEYEREVVHRDDMVIVLRNPRASRTTASRRHGNGSLHVNHERAARAWRRPLRFLRSCHTAVTRDTRPPPKHKAWMPRSCRRNSMNVASTPYGLVQAVAWCKPPNGPAGRQRSAASCRRCCRRCQGRCRAGGSAAGGRTGRRRLAPRPPPPRGRCRSAGPGTGSTSPGRTWPRS
jgi:PUA domain